MDDLEGQIESYDMGQKTLSEEIAELETNEAVDAQLSELKARMQKSDTPEAPSSTNQNATH